MITLEKYWMGRDKTHTEELTIEHFHWASEMVRKANLLLDRYIRANPDAVRPEHVNSGWRPVAINAKVKGAAKLSNHTTCKAIDLGDPDNKLDRWLLTDAGQLALEECELWMEHPSATPGWCHLQLVQNRSWVEGKPRFFYP